MNEPTQTQCSETGASTSNIYVGVSKQDDQASITVCSSNHGATALQGKDESAQREAAGQWVEHLILCEKEWATITVWNFAALDFFSFNSTAAVCSPEAESAMCEPLSWEKVIWLQLSIPHTAREAGLGTQRWFFFFLIRKLIKQEKKTQTNQT